MTGDPFTFHVWWRNVDGRTYADVKGYRELTTAQKALTQLHDDMGRWPEKVVACGMSKIHCPKGGPWPRPGEAGYEPHLVRSPEDSGERAA